MRRAERVASTSSCHIVIAIFPVCVFASIQLREEKNAFLHLHTRNSSSPDSYVYGVVCWREAAERKKAIHVQIRANSISNHHRGVLISVDFVALLAAVRYEKNCFLLLLLLVRVVFCLESNKKKNTLKSDRRSIYTTTSGTSFSSPTTTSQLAHTPFNAIAPFTHSACVTDTIYKQTDIYTYTARERERA